MYIIKLTQFSIFISIKGTRQISNQAYGACIQMADGYCGIIWTRNTTGGDNGFSITDNVVATGNLVGKEFG